MENGVQCVMMDGMILMLVWCSGSESTLASCGHLGVNVTRSCSHSNDAGVRCSRLQGKMQAIVSTSSITSLIIAV